MIDGTLRYHQCQCFLLGALFFFFSFVSPEEGGIEGECRETLTQKPSECGESLSLEKDDEAQKGKIYPTFIPSSSDFYFNLPVKKEPKEREREKLQNFTKRVKER